MPQQTAQKEYNSSSIPQVFLSLFLLLLAFFVFLNSISSYEKNKSYDVARSVRANFANFVGQGESIDLIGQVNNDKISPNTLKLLENKFRVVIPTITLSKNNRSDNIAFDIPLKSLFDASSASPTKTAEVIFRDISGILKSEEGNQPLKLEMFMGYSVLSGGLKLDKRLQSRMTFLVDSLLQAGAPKGLFSIGLEPRKTDEIRFRFSIAQRKNVQHKGASLK